MCPLNTTSFALILDNPKYVATRFSSWYNWRKNIHRVSLFFTINLTYEFYEKLFR